MAVENGTWRVVWYFYVTKTKCIVISWGQVTTANLYTHQNASGETKSIFLRGYGKFTSTQNWFCPKTYCKQNHCSHKDDCFPTITWSAQERQKWAGLRPFLRTLTLSQVGSLVGLLAWQSVLRHDSTDNNPSRTVPSNDHTTFHCKDWENTRFLNDFPVMTSNNTVSMEKTNEMRHDREQRHWKIVRANTTKVILEETRSLQQTAIRYSSGYSEHCFSVTSRVTNVRLFKSFNDVDYVS